MSGHTPGVLSWDEGSPEITRRWNDGDHPVAFVENRLAWHENRHCGIQEAGANARRFVACWNACLNVPTEQLEVEPLADEIARLKESCGSYRRVIEAMGGNADGIDWPRVGPQLAAALRKIVERCRASMLHEPIEEPSPDAPWIPVGLLMEAMEALALLDQPAQPDRQS